MADPTKPSYGSSPSSAPPPSSTPAQASGQQPATSGQPPATQPARPKAVQNPLTLIMPLKSAELAPKLTGMLIASQETLNAALNATNLVHFARFVFLDNNTKFGVITSYDGTLAAYVQAFVDDVGDIFDALLQFMADPPPLPVQKFPKEFLAYVNAHNVPVVSQFYSAYPELTVLDIRANASE